MLRLRALSSSSSSNKTGGVKARQLLENVGAAEKLYDILNHPAHWNSTKHEITTSYD